MKKSRIFYGWWVVAAGAINLAFSTTMVNTLSGLYVVPISSDMEITKSIYQVTNTIIYLTSVLSTFIIGRKMNNQNLKKIQVTATLLFALAFGAYGFASNIWHLYMASFIIGATYMFAGMLSTSVIIANWFEKSQGLAMSIVLAGVGIGGTVLSPITTTLITNYGWRASRIYLSIAYVLITLPLIILLMKSSPDEMGLKPYGYDLNNHVNKKQGSDLQSKDGTDRDLKQINKTKYYYLFMVGTVASGIVCGGGMQHIGSFTTELHNPMFASMITSLYSFSAIFGKLLLGWIHDKLGGNKSLLFGCTSFSLAFILMAFFGQSSSVMIIAAILYGTGNSIGSVSLNLTTYSTFGRDNYSYALSKSKSFQMIGMATGPVILALIYDYKGSYTLPWIICFVITIIVFVTWVKSHNNSQNKKSDLALSSQ